MNPTPDLMAHQEYISLLQSLIKELSLSGSENGTADLIQNFYSEFAKRSPDPMANAYASAATFADPVFTHLEGWQIGAMWKMLCERASPGCCQIPRNLLNSFYTQT